MRKREVFAALLTLFGSSFGAGAAVTNVSLAVADWQKTNLVFGGTDYQGPATVANTASGHLLGTKTTATGGTNYSLGLHTVATYNLQDATLRYNWRLSGQGSYSGIYTGLDTGDGHAHLINNFDPNSPFAGFMTTAWSYLGSEIIPSDGWLWTEVTFSANHYDFTVSKTGYGNTDFLHGSKAIASTTWDALVAAHPFFQLGDNYVAGAYFEVADLSITTRDVPPGPSVPEPVSLALLALGLAGLGAVRLSRSRVS
ncbi:MAG: PEP-CTERM motif protein [Candidatus Accumulibacter adjunctus]|uniref:PEP-CTERM motif protein n=1 Tax=Candidatus Accumulibacter adjunctus TaxID=1454001 RepID=A0A011MFV5_9PROT|nr:MAG: PEP-CTERM motif protein [Candidatus Accumulibacter adjunctus]